MIYEIKNLKFKYANSEKLVLDGVNLKLEKGKILSILGPNGTGKTTLLNCMLGHLKPEAGEVKLKGKEIQNLSAKEIANTVAYVPQLHTPTFDYKVIDYVMMGKSPGLSWYEHPSDEDRDACIKVLADLNIEYLAEKSYLDISGGERQQVLIARALASEPEAIIFDEPTAHLDYGNQHKVLKIIKEMSEKGYSIIITTHNPDHAFMLNDEAALLNREGKIEQGKCDFVITEEKLSKVYNINLSIKYLEEAGRKVCIAPEL